MTEIQKKKMIKLIHTQKACAGIDDEAYVRILMDAANVQSSLSLQAMPQFSAVIAALNKLLVSQGQAPLGGSTQRVHRDVYPLVKRAERVFGSDAGKRLGGFIHKLGKSSVNDLSPLEIRKCHGFLTRIEQGAR
jgi:hypothetical protein